MSNLNDKATKAASRYLEHRGYTVLETAWKCPAGTCDVIAEDGDAIVFVDVSARCDTDKGFPTERCSAGIRERREMVALAWFAEHEDAVDMAVRFDNIAMLVMGDSRAMIRHHPRRSHRAAAAARGSGHPDRGRPSDPPGGRLDLLASIAGDEPSDLRGGGLFSNSREKRWIQRGRL